MKPLAYLPPPQAEGPKVLGSRVDAYDYAILRAKWRHRRQRVRPVGCGRWLVTDA